MKELIPVFSILISGLFGVLIAVVTWKLANKREKQKFLQDLDVREYHNLKEVYVSLIASLDKIIKSTKQGADIDVLITVNPGLL